MNTIARRLIARLNVRRVVAGLIAMTALIGGLVFTTSSAHAATSVSACFKWTTGAAYASQPVQLLQWNGSRWVTVRNGKTNSSGCGTFYNTSVGTYYTFAASVTHNTGYYLNSYRGYAPHASHTGHGNSNVGTGYVYLVAQTRSPAATAASAWGY